MRKKSPPRRAPLPYELRNLDHRPPVTRRQFMARGMLGTSATVIGMSSVFGLLAHPRKAYADLAGDISACNIRAGAGKVPFIVFDLAGGGNIAGSNALVGGVGGQMDLLSTAGYNKLGIPGNMIPTASGANVDTTLGLAMHLDSAYLRGITSMATPATTAFVNGAVIPAISQTDTDLNPHNPMYGVNTYGAAGGLLALIGTQSTVSGGNSMAPAYMVNAAVMPTKVSRPSDVTGLVSTGQLVGPGSLSQPEAVDVLQSADQISKFKLGQVSTGLTTDASVKNNVWCTYVDAAYLVNTYGDPSALDPKQDTDITGIFSSADLMDSDFLATASVMKMVIQGYAGAGTIEMGGFDYHTGDRSTGEMRDYKAGQCIGACLEYARRKGKPLMIYVLTDGSLVSNGMTDNSVNGRGKGVWTADNTATAATLMLVFDPRGRPMALTNQIGSYNSDGTVSANSSQAANAVNLLAETVVLNYMALHGDEGRFETMQWAGGVRQGLGDSSTYKSLLAFTQLSSVSGGVIV